MVDKMDLTSAASKEGLMGMMKAAMLAYSLVVRTEKC